MSRALHPLAERALSDPASVARALEMISDRAELVVALQDLCRVIVALRPNDPAGADRLQKLGERALLRFREKQGEMHRLLDRDRARAAQFAKFVSGAR